MSDTLVLLKTAYGFENITVARDKLNQSIVLTDGRSMIRLSQEAAIQLAQFIQGDTK